MGWTDKGYTLGPIAGLDAGVNGAITFLDTSTWKLDVYDVPKVKKIVAGNTRSHVDHVKLANIIKSKRPCVIVTELLWSRPGQNAQGTFSLGRYTGQVEMASSMLGCDLMQPTPQEWKAMLSVSSDKDLSIARAIQLIPALAPILTRKGDHDRGEAALLAFYGALKLGKVPGKITLGELHEHSPPRKKKAA